jgi:hypothetical protein
MHSRLAFRCRRPQEGLFGLREWVDEGFLPPLPEQGPPPPHKGPLKAGARVSRGPARGAHAALRGGWKGGALDDFWAPKQPTVDSLTYSVGTMWVGVAFGGHMRVGEGTCE